MMYINQVDPTEEEGIVGGVVCIVEVRVTVVAGGGESRWVSLR